MSGPLPTPIIELTRRGKRPWRKLAAALVLALCTAVVIFVLRDKVSLEELAQRETQMRTWYREQPLTILTLAFGVYFLTTSLSVPTVWPLSVAYGWVFGFLPALLVVSLASSAGATVAMLISRYLLRDYVQERFSARWHAVNRGLEHEGATFLLTLRLIPVVPFFLVNWLMGVTAFPVRTFWWVSQIGMLPATIVYVWAGASVPTLSVLRREGAAGLFSWQLIAALCALGMFPFVVRRTVSWWRRRRGAR